MYYRVKARYIPEAAAELYCRLTDGSIAGQKPDGREIVASMQRARITEPGVACWSAVCYCPTPLEHERQTVYDRFFTDMQIEEVEDYVPFDGQPLMDHLARSASETP